MLKFIRNLKIRSKLYVLIGLNVVCILFSIAGEVWIVDTVRIGGHSYTSVKDGYEKLQQFAVLNKKLTDNRLNLVSEIYGKPADVQKSRAYIDGLNDEIDAMFETLKKGISNSTILSSLNGAQAFWASYKIDEEDIVEPGIVSNNRAKAIEYDNTVQKTRYDNINELTFRAQTEMEKLIYDNEGFIGREAVQMQIGFMVFYAIFILVNFLLALSMIKVITNPVLELLGITREISKGNLSVKVNHLGSKDEIGQLETEFDHFIKSMNANLLQVAGTSDELKISSAASSDLMNKSESNITIIKDSVERIDVQTENSTSSVEELTATVEEMSRNIDSIMGNMVRQAAAVEEGASSIEEMVRNIENTASMSKKTQDISNNLNKVSADGGTAVKASVQSIKEVSDYSQQILKLLGLITNIAKQTNLLAMNAAIEAAHAGDAGKGFAIVADEIRRLSEDTNKNARDIGEVVSSIVSKIDDSVKLSEKAGVGLDMITAYSQQNVQIISQLSIAMAEQNNGAKEILKSTQEMVRITEEVKLAMTEQKNATDDFTNALRGLRDLSLEIKQNTRNHLDNFSELVSAIDQIRKAIEQNQNRANKLHELVDAFTLDEGSNSSPNEKTGLKLVE